MLPKIRLIFILIVSFSLLLNSCSSSSSIKNNTFIGVGKQSLLYADFFEDDSIVMIGATKIQNEVLSTEQDINLFFFDKDLNILNEISIGGEENEHFVKAKVISDKLYLVLNTSSNEIQDSQSFGGVDGLILVINKLGIIEELYRYGGSGEDAFIRAEFSNSGDIYILGKSDSIDGHFSNSNYDEENFLIKIDNKGRIVQSKFLENSFDHFALDDFSNSYLAESYSGLILKMNSSFEIISSVIIDEFYRVSFQDLEVDLNNNIIFIGVSSNKFADNSLIIMKLDANLTKVWGNTYLRPVGVVGIFNKIIILENNNILILGYGEFKFENAYYIGYLDKTENFILGIDGSGNFKYGINHSEYFDINYILKFRENYLMLGSFYSLNSDYPDTFDNQEGIYFFTDNLFIPIDKTISEKYFN